MAKALFLSLPLSGHTNPSLPLVRELVSRGEQVVYYTTEAFREKVERTGAIFRAYDVPFLSNLSALPERLHELSWLMARTTAEVLERHLEEFRGYAPKYVLADSVGPWGQWAGQILGAPVVTSTSTMAINRHVFAFAAQHRVQPKSFRLAVAKAGAVFKAVMQGRKLKAKYRVRGPGTMAWVCGSSNLNIVYTSRYFQPCEETFDERYQFVGPSIDDRGDAEGLPREWNNIIYISLGTLFNTDTAFYRKCFEAFGDEAFRCVLSVGSEATAENLGTSPANFVVRARVPQLEVLQQAKVFVTHGGMNSVSESLYYGVPMVVIPQMSEQAIVGRRVEQLGTGLFLDKKDVTAERLRASLRRVMEEQSFREKALLVRESFLKAGGVSGAADSILKFAGR